MMVIVERWQPVVRAALESMGECGNPRRCVRELLQPFVQATLEDPKLAMTTAAIVLFSADGRHRREVLSMVDGLEEALARLLTEFCVPNPEVAARLIVSGALVELNRTRTGRAEELPIEERIAQLVDVVIGPHRVRNQGVSLGELPVY